jgi:exodeoxyribonuclease VII small subunit
MGTERERHRPDQTTTSSLRRTTPSPGSPPGDADSSHSSHSSHSSRSEPPEPGLEEAAAEPLDFEEALGRLDELVEVLEQGRISLEEALTLYEEGVLMADRCQRLLDQAQIRLQRLSVASPEAGADDKPTFVLESFRLDEDM